MTAAIETLKEYGLVIGGQSTPSATGNTFETVSPTTNLPIGRVPLAGNEDAERAISAARHPSSDRARSTAWRTSCANESTKSRRSRR